MKAQDKTTFSVLAMYLMFLQAKHTFFGIILLEF